MIARNNHQMAAGLLQIAHETVIQLSRIAGRRSGVEDVPGHEDGIHLVRLCHLKQPVEKRFMFGGAAFTVKVLSQMPVRGVKYAHNRSVAKKSKRDYKHSGEGR